jgi:DNA helicase HerA-like ATPase
MSIQFKRAERKQRKFKGCIAGTSGSGKTWTALEIAKGLAGPSGKIAVGDTEQSSAALYADHFAFDHVDLPNTSVKAYVELINAAVANKYDVLVIDSLSHAWEYLLEEVDNVQARGRGNSFTAWKSVTPIYKQLVEAIVKAPIHIVATMRAKTDYVMEEVQGSDGKTRQVPKKVGLAPVFRQGGEYEFDVMCTIDIDHRLIFEKTRIPQFADRVLLKPDSKIGAEIGAWLAGGAVEEKAPAVTETIKAAAAAGDLESLLDHRIETKCSKQGTPAGQLIKEDREWVLKALARDISPADRFALEALLALATEPVPVADAINV